MERVAMRRRISRSVGTYSPPSQPRGPPVEQLNDFLSPVEQAQRCVEHENHLQIQRCAEHENHLQIMMEVSL